jgi:hypothetical protein
VSRPVLSGTLFLKDLTALGELDEGYLLRIPIASWAAARTYRPASGPGRGLDHCSAPRKSRSRTRNEPVRC